VNPADKFSCQALKLALQVDCMILGWIQSTDGGAIISGSCNYYTVANHLRLLKNLGYGVKTAVLTLDCLFATETLPEVLNNDPYPLRN